MGTFRAAVLISLCLWADLASAFCGRGHRSPAQEYRESSIVFVGRVVSEEATRESEGYFEGSTYSLEVNEPLRGVPAKAIKIFSENSSGRFPMKVGRRYIIFAYEERGRLTVDNCGNSGELPQEAAVLSAIRRLRRPQRTHGSQPPSKAGAAEP